MFLFPTSTEVVSSYAMGSGVLLLQAWGEEMNARAAAERASDGEMLEEGEGKDAYEQEQA